MRCKECNQNITWDTSYGKVEYLICEDCWHQAVNDFGLPTAYQMLMQKGTEAYEKQQREQRGE